MTLQVSSHLIPMTPYDRDYKYSHSANKKIEVRYGKIKFAQGDRTSKYLDSTIAIILHYN